MSSIASEIAGTIQAGHIEPHPDPIHDLAPETASSKKQPVSLHAPKSQPDNRATRDHDDLSIDEEEEDEVDDDETDIPYSVLRPLPRSQGLPPLPDLRFEQSYLHSIAKADTWGKVVLITLRDQVMMPLAQGMIYNLVLCGWQHWNKNAQLHGNTVGARVRRWWWGVNNWTITQKKTR